MENRRNSRLDRPSEDWNPNEHDTSRDPRDQDRPRDFTRPAEERDTRGWRDEPRRQSPVGRSGGGRGQDSRDQPRRDNPDNRRRDDRDGTERPRQDRGERQGSDGKERRSGGYDKPRPAFRPEPDEMVYGIQSVIETLRSGQQIDKLYMEKSLSNGDIQQLAFQNRVTIQRVPVEKLDRLTRKNHQGVVCLVAAVPYVKLSNVLADVNERGELPFILLLDRITDVRNFGAIARTAECAGVQCIVIPGKGSAAINSDAMKTSSGALNHISVCREFNLVDTVDFLQKSGVQVLACTEKSHRDLYTLTNDLTGPVAIVMGSEEDGISPDVLRAVDGHVKIPLLGEVGSLNVSVATGIMLYEVVRQRSAK